MPLCVDARGPAHVEVVQDDAVCLLLGCEVEAGCHGRPVDVIVQHAVPVQGHAHGFQDLGVGQGDVLHGVV